MSEINIRETPEYKSAMEKARCEAKGRDAITGKECEIHIHHIKPIAKYPELACDPNNLIPINAEIHIDFVHNGNMKCLKGLTEEQIKSYMELHLKCEGIKAPFHAIKKETPAKLGITKKDIIANPHKYDGISLTSGLRNLYMKLIYEENFKNTHGGLTPDEYKNLQNKCRRQYNIYKANIARKEAPVEQLSPYQFRSLKIRRILKAISPYPLTLSAISEISGVEKSETKEILKRCVEMNMIKSVMEDGKTYYFNKYSYKFTKYYKHII